MNKQKSSSPDNVLDKKSRATNFEISIKDFLERLQFDDVDGGRDNFLIGGVQVDVCGGHENTLLVIECTMKQSLGKTKSLRDKISEFRGKREILEKAFKKELFLREHVGPTSAKTRKEDRRKKAKEHHGKSK